MMDKLFNTAVRDGNYISINEFSTGTGERCNCICPECGEKVRSNVTSKSPEELKRNYTNHFSHINENSQCAGGCLETELHLFAKEVIAKNDTLMVPGEQYDHTDTLEYTSVILEKAFPIEKYKQYRPDIIITSITGEKIAIEIIVTNPLSESKAQLYKAAVLKCLTIDLSGYQKNDIDLLKKKLRKI